MNRVGRVLGAAAFHGFAVAMAIFLLAPFVLSLAVSLNPARRIALPTVESGLSLEWYRVVLGNDLYVQGLRTSMVVGVGVAVLSLVLAVPLVLGMSGSSRRARLSGLVIVPATVPTVVLGMQGLIFFEAIGLRGSILTVVLAHTLWGLPLAMLVVKAAHDRLDPRVVEAARSLGATRWRATWEVTLPLLGPAMAVGAILAFVASLNELVMTLFLRGGDVRTLPTVIWPQVQQSVSPDVAAASSLLLGAALLACGLALLVWRRQTRR